MQGIIVWTLTSSDYICDIYLLQGYAFIEFNKSEEAQKCLLEFTKMGCKLPTSMPPEELSTIKLFSVEEPPDDQTADIKLEKEDSDEPPKKKKKSKDKKHQKALELKPESEIESDTDKKLEISIKVQKIVL